MNGDFAAEVDAALNARLAALWAAADEARERIETAIETLPKPVEPTPVYFREQPSGGAAVTFEGMGDEYALEADAEGIPLPEDNL